MEQPFSALGRKHRRQLFTRLLRWRAAVLADTDPEPLHQMRVTARRLRVALATFAACYPEEPAQHLARQIKRLQRALGALRDTDVLLGHLRDLKASAPADQHRAIAWLIAQHSARRADQMRVVQRRLRKRRVARLRAAYHATLPASAAPEPPLLPERSLAAHLQPLLLGHLAELRQWSEQVRDPAHTEEQHRLRIAAKRLRYTLELVDGALTPSGSRFIPALGRLQDVLGTLHDQTVLVENIQHALAQDAHPPEDRERAALQALLATSASAQQATYANFLGCWEDWETHATLAQLEQWARALGPTPDEQHRCGGLDVDDWPHARHVAALAHTLFWETAALHQLDERAAALLERAALLHNAGMLIETRRHHKHSYALINAATLPDVSPAERHEIACIARYHRRALPSEGHPEYARMPEATRQRISHLAALLRLADALDYHHDGRVEQVRVELSQDSVQLWLTVSPGRSAAKEIQHAQAKADLFTRVFGRKVYITKKQGQA